MIGVSNMSKSVINNCAVTKIRGIIESLGHTIATPAEARNRLALKGADAVKF
jgi:uncharacterized protein (DUF849 family)